MKTYDDLTNNQKDEFQRLLHASFRDAPKLVAGQGGYHGPDTSFFKYLKPEEIGWDDLFILVNSPADDKGKCSFTMFWRTAYIPGLPNEPVSKHNPTGGHLRGQCFLSELSGKVSKKGKTWVEYRYLKDGLREIYVDGKKTGDITLTRLLNRQIIEKITDSIDKAV